MKVFVSNQLQILSDALYEKLFDKMTTPLEKRWVIVPTDETKMNLYLKWLEKREVITGIQTLTYGQLVRKVFPDLPSQMELSLRIETALTRLELGPGFTPYLQGQKKLDLAEELSGTFLKYLQKPLHLLSEWLSKEGWQQAVWKEVFGVTLPTQTIRPLEGACYFYHIGKMAPYEWDVFSQMESYWFLFSPSEMYLGDFQTEREQLYSLHKAKGQTREELLRYFQQDSPLLSNWGVAGRELFHFFEEAETEEHFAQPDGNSALQQLQKEWLTFEKTECKADLSIQLHSAPSLLREVEVVWEIIERLRDSPREILVLAPDIQPYVAAIEWVFKQRGGTFDYTVTGLEAKTHSLFLQGVETLLSLPRHRFSREIFEKLLLAPPFLKRFDLKLEEAQTLRSWMQKTHLRYDLTQSEGSWETALQRAIESLVLMQDNPPIYLDCTKAFLLNRWIEITLKMKEMMHPALNPITFSGPQWADWIEELIDAFLVGEEEADVLKAILSTLRNERVKGSFSYETIERLLFSTLTSRTGHLHRTTPQAVRFSSLQPGAVTSAKTIIMMGMQEGAFPRLEPSSSLPVFSLPSKAEADRYLFLEALTHATDRIIFTYSRCHADDGKEMHPSALVEELKKDRGDLWTYHHPISALDPTYYQSNGFPSYSSIHYDLLSKIPAQDDPQWKLSESPPPTTLDIRLFRKLARNPIQFFFEESLGIRFTREESDSEFLFSPLEMYHVRNTSLRSSTEEIVLELQRQGKLPTGSFRDAALQTIETEISRYHETLEKLEIDPSSIFTLEISPYATEPLWLSQERLIAPPLTVGSSTLCGSIEGLTPEGVLFHGEDSLEDLLKIWPLFCIAQAVLGEKCTKIFCTKKGTSVEIKLERPLASLTRYYDYLQKNLTAPSPLLPAWGRRLLKKGELPETSDDPIIEWARTRNLLPSNDVWIEEWKSYLEEVVRELL